MKDIEIMSESTVLSSYSSYGIDNWRISRRYRRHMRVKLETVDIENSS